MTNANVEIIAMTAPTNIAAKMINESADMYFSLTAQCESYFAQPYLTVKCCSATSARRFRPNLNKFGSTDTIGTRHPVHSG